MEVVRQYHNGVDRKRAPHSRGAERCAQQCDIIGEQPQPAFSKIYRKEKATAGDKVAAIGSHRPDPASVRWASLRSAHPTSRPSRLSPSVMASGASRNATV